MFKLVAFMITSTIAFGVGGSTGRHAKHRMGTINDVPVIQAPGELKVLAEGFHSPVMNSFVAVARDSETYAILLKWDSNLPHLDEGFFKTNVIVAVFLGQRNTGGYKIQITREASGDIRIAEQAPGKGLMVPQMITSPFQVVSVPIAEPLLLSLDSPWRAKLRAYQVTNGTFTMSGGFAGIREQFGFKGELRILREGDLVTFALGLLSSGLPKQRSLIGFVTGVIDREGHMTIAKMGADSFVNSPNGGLKATGQFAGKNKLSLLFSPGPSMILDGYAGDGNLEAELVSSSEKPLMLVRN